MTLFFVSLSLCESDKNFTDHWTEHVALSVTIFTYLPFYLPLKAKQIYIRIGPNVRPKETGRNWDIGCNGKKKRRVTHILLPFNVQSIRKIRLFKKHKRKFSLQFFFLSLQLKILLSFFHKIIFLNIKISFYNVLDPDNICSVNLIYDCIIKNFNFLCTLFFLREREKEQWKKNVGNQYNVGIVIQVSLKAHGVMSTAPG